VPLSFDHCTFAYRRSRPPVIAGFSLDVSAGRTILLGPNGAGKSTLFALGSSALTPQQGCVRVGPLNSRKRGDRRRYRATVAWMPQSVAAVAGCSTREQVALAGWLKGLSRPDAWDAAGRALGQVGLVEKAEVKATELSGGQRARMGLAQALVHEASVLLLDEPTASLDPAQRHNFLAVVEELAEERSIVVSTHDVNDLATAFDRVLVLDGGRVTFDGTVTQFLAPDGSPLTAVGAYRHQVSSQ
jgi:ABC-2 type transport system ATP-binding protein